ncbi:MAG TPA: DUF5916 domain-containing protein, partial [Gemmatimonadales bacterium]|nr:DUF5916 domain-containing protein [Gemmatimonadales bacterium]
LAALQDPGSGRPPQAPPPVAQVPRIEAEVSVDGQLDEPAWAQAARLTGFRQYQPVDSRPAEQETEVRVWYSPSAIHFGIIASDASPQSIRATVADRDNLGDEDRVTIYIDTFNDQRRAFIFGVNARGAQEDGVRSEGQFTPGELMAGNVDLNPDYRWESQGRITESGYEVEIRIPFKSLRFPGGSPQTWGLNIVRVTQRTGYQDTWADTRRANSSFLAQSGTVTGLEGMERGIVTEVQPFVTTAFVGARAPGGDFEREDPDPSAGVNARLGFTNFSLDATVNPDFSTIESDEGQVTVNERFALFFPEKRPFFLEGIELFATPNRLVYTRQIGDPLGGAKFTGKFGRLATAYLAALDETPGEDDALFNIARARYDLGAASTAGMTYTDRVEGDAYNRVAAADAHLVFARLYFIEAQLGGSWTRDDAGTRSGPIGKLEFDRTGRSWGFNYRLNAIDPDFATRAGFVNRTGIVEGSAFNRLSFYGGRGATIENFTTFFGLNRLWLYDDFGLDDALEGDQEVNTRFTFRGGWTAGTNIEHRFVRFAPGTFAGYEVSRPGGAAPFVPADEVTGISGSVSISTPTFQMFSAGVEVGLGEAPIFAEAAEGHGLQLSGNLTLRPASSVRATASVRYFRLFRDRDDSEFARSIIPRLKAEFQPTRALFLRFIGEYRAERQAALADPATGAPILIDGSVAGATETNGFRMDWLAAYEPTPGTAFYFGYGSTLEDTGPLSFSDLRRSDDAFFLKAAYLFRR